MGLLRRKRVGQPKSSTHRRRPLRKALRNIAKTAFKVATTPARLAARAILHPKATAANVRYLLKRKRKPANTPEEISQQATDEIRNEVDEKSQVFQDENPDLLSENEQKGDDSTIINDEAGEIVDAESEDLESEGYDFFDMPSGVLAANIIANSNGFDLVADSFDDEGFDEFGKRFKRGFKKLADALAKPLDTVLESTGAAGKIIAKLRRGIVQNAKDKSAAPIQEAVTTVMTNPVDREAIKNTLFPETKITPIMIVGGVLLIIGVVFFIVKSKKS